MNLLDTIRNNSATPQQGATDETNKLQTLLRAKSGKAGLAPGVATSNLGEQAAVAQTNQVLQQQVAPQAQLQQAQLQQQSSEIQQQGQQQKAEIAQANKFDNLQTNLKISQTLNDLSRNKGEIDVAKQGAALEQVATGLRLQNKKYVDDLQREGAIARLNDDAAFKQAALRTTFGNKMEMANKIIDNDSIFNDNDREFKKKVAQVDIGSAYNMLSAEMAANKQQALWQGLGSLAKAGIGAAASYKAPGKTAADIDKDAGGNAARNDTNLTDTDTMIG